MMKRILPLLAIALLLGAGLIWKSGVLTPAPGATDTAFSNGPATERNANAPRPGNRAAQGERQGERQGQRANRPNAGGRPSAQRGRRFPTAKVVVASVEEKMMAPSAAAPGTIISRNDSRIAAEVSGKIVSIVEVGDIVEKDGIIALLDNAQAELTVRERRADVARLAARSAFLADRYKRFADLGDELGESETSLLQMRSERDEAQQQVNSAKVALERANFLLERTKIRSPFAGRVVSRNVQIGEFANPGSQIARIVDTTNLEVRTQASASLVSALSAGDLLNITKGDEILQGTVRAIVPVGDEVSRTLEMRVSLPEGSDWFVGAAVRVTVPSARPRLAVTAPRDALHIRNDSIDVYRISENNKAQKIPVELGVADGDLIEIIGDIEPGDRLVIRGGERLSDGQTVDIAEPA